MENGFIDKIYDFGVMQLFDGVINYVSVLKLVKNKKNSFEYIIVSNIGDVYKNKQGLVYQVENLEKEYWFLTGDEEFKEQYDYTMENFPCIEEEIEATNGIQTSKNSVYVIKENEILREDNNIIFFKKNNVQYEIEKGILREYYAPPKGKGIKRSYQNIKATAYVVFPYVKGDLISENDAETYLKYNNNNVKHNDNINRIESEADKIRESIKQENAQRITQAANENANRDTQSNSTYANAYLNALQYNNNIENQKIAGIGQANADAINQNGIAYAQAQQANGNIFGSAIANSGQAFATAFDTIRKDKQSFSDVYMGLGDKDKITAAILRYKQKGDESFIKSLLDSNAVSEEDKTKLREALK